MSDGSATNATTTTTHADAIDSLDPIDRAFLAQRFAAGPLILGLISIVTSLVLIGLLFGALGVRAGVDLWRAGSRSGVVIAGLITSVIGVVVSIAWTIMWGAILASVLLGRDAIREAQKWRGLDVIAVSAPALDERGATTVQFSALPSGIERTALLFISVGGEPCIDALRGAALVVATMPSCQLVIVDANAPVEAVRAFAARYGSNAAAIGSEFAFPPPLARVAAFPTLVIVDAHGRIESAIVGTHPNEDITKIMRGDAALPQAQKP